MPTNAQTIGGRIALLRQARRLSQGALGEPNCTAGDIARLESGREHPPDGLVGIFALRLGCPPLYLLAGVPPERTAQLKAAFTVTEQVLRRSDPRAALQRYSNLLIDPATILLPDLHIEGYRHGAHARELTGDYIGAATWLEQVTSRLNVHHPQWIPAQAALIRCQRLAGNLDRAEDTTRAVLAHIGIREDDPALQDADTVIAAELLAIFADRGHPLDVRRLTAVLAARAPRLRARQRFAVYHAIAYANLRAGDTDTGIETIFRVYRISTDHHLQPPPRLIDACIHLLRDIPDPTVSTAAFARFASQLRSQNQHPADNARLLIRTVLADLATGQPIKALEHCDAMLAEAIGAYPAASAKVIAVYGQALAAAGLHPDEASVARHEASAFLTQPLTDPTDEHPEAARAATAIDRTEWVDAVPPHAFPPSAPSAAPTPYTPPTAQHPSAADLRAPSQ